MSETVSIVLGVAGSLLMLAATTSMGLVAYLFRSLQRSVEGLRAEVQSLSLAVEGMKVTEQRLAVVEKTADDHEGRIRVLEHRE